MKFGKIVKYVIHHHHLHPHHHHYHHHPHHDDDDHHSINHYHNHHVTRGLSTTSGLNEAALNLSLCPSLFTAVDHQQIQQKYRANTNANTNANMHMQIQMSRMSTVIFHSSCLSAKTTDQFNVIIIVLGDFSSSLEGSISGV